MQNMVKQKQQTRLGRGSFADVYEIPSVDGGTDVLKVFRPGIGLEMILHEFQAATAFYTRMGYPRLPLIILLNEKGEIVEQLSFIDEDATERLAEFISEPQYGIGLQLIHLGTTIKHWYPSSGDHAFNFFLGLEKIVLEALRLGIVTSDLSSTNVTYEKKARTGELKNPGIIDAGGLSYISSISSDQLLGLIAQPGAFFSIQVHEEFCRCVLAETDLGKAFQDWCQMRGFSPTPQEFANWSMAEGTAFSSDLNYIDVLVKFLEIKKSYQVDWGHNIFRPSLSIPPIGPDHFIATVETLNPATIFGSLNPTSFDQIQLVQEFDLLMLFLQKLGIRDLYGILPNPTDDPKRILGALQEKILSRVRLGEFVIITEDAFKSQHKAAFAKMGIPTILDDAKLKGIYNAIVLYLRLYWQRIVAGDSSTYVPSVHISDIWQVLYGRSAVDGSVEVVFAEV